MSRIQGRTLARRNELTLPLVEEFLATKQDREKRSDKTLALYRWSLMPFADAFPVLTWEQSEIEDFCIDIVPETERSAGTVHTHFKDIRTFYYWLSRRKGFPKLDLTKPALPEMVSHATFWTQEEMSQILHKCQEQWERCAVVALAQTGARREELISIRLADFHEETVVSKLGGKYFGAWARIPSKVTKANKIGQRVIYLPHEAAVEVIHCMGGRDRLWAGRRPLDIEKIKRGMRELIQRAGLWEKGRSCHSFRHTWSAEYLENGGEGLLVDPLLGHFKGDITHDYLHFRLHLPERQLMESAFVCAPRRFLQLTLDLEKAEKQEKARVRLAEKAART